MRGPLALLVAVATPASADEVVRSGTFHTGVSGDAELGPLEAVSAGGVGFGARLALAAQVEINPSWALRLPLVLGVTGSGNHYDSGFAELALIPGVVYRFRDPKSPWIPYVGGGIALGAWGADRPLLDLPVPIPARCCDGHVGDLGFGGGHGGHSDPNFDTDFGAGIELWGGTEVRLAPWLGAVFGLDLGFVHVDDVRVTTIAETIELRLSL